MYVDRNAGAPSALSVCSYEAHKPTRCGASLPHTAYQQLLHANAHTNSCMSSHSCLNRRCNVAVIRYNSHWEHGNPMLHLQSTDTHAYTSAQNFKCFYEFELQHSITRILQTSKYLQKHLDLTISVCVARVEVRAAPSLRFAYVEPRLMRLYLKFKRPEQAPSMVAKMDLREFAGKAQQGCTDAPLFYPDGEYYYMQTQVTREMRLSGDLDFKQPPFSVVLAPGEY